MNDRENDRVSSTSFTSSVLPLARYPSSLSGEKIEHCLKVGESVQKGNSQLVSRGPPSPHVQPPGLVLGTSREGAEDSCWGFATKHPFHLFHKHTANFLGKSPKILSPCALMGNGLHPSSRGAFIQA